MYWNCNIFLSSWLKDLFNTMYNLFDYTIYLFLLFCFRIVCHHIVQLKYIISIWYRNIFPFIVFIDNDNLICNVIADHKFISVYLLECVTLFKLSLHCHV